MNDLNNNFDDIKKSLLDNPMLERMDKGEFENNHIVHALHLDGFIIIFTKTGIYKMKTPKRKYK